MYPFLIPLPVHRYGDKITWIELEAHLSVENIETQSNEL